MSTENTESQSKEEKKVAAAYDNALNKAFALLGGKNFKPVANIPSDGMEAVMEEFFGEEIKAKKEEFKGKLKELLVKKVKFDNFIKEQERAFKKTILDKKKEFTKDINEVVSLVSGIDGLKDQYLDALKTSEGTSEDTQSTE